MSIGCLSDFYRFSIGSPADFKRISNGFLWYVYWMCLVCLWDFYVICLWDFYGYFYDVYGCWPGSAHNSRVLSASSLYQRAEEGVFNGADGNAVVVDGVTITPSLKGDSGYGLHNWLLTPYDQERTEAHKAWNAMIRSVRGCVESGSAGCAKPCGHSLTIQRWVHALPVRNQSVQCWRRVQQGPAVWPPCPPATPCPARAP